MPITGWECFLVETPTHADLTTTYGAPERLRPRVVVRLTDDEGHEGLGEASPLPFFTGETAASIKLQLEQRFLPALVGRDPFDHDAIMAVLDDLLPANTSAKSAVDMALYDLRGKILGRPVYQLLGGLRCPEGFEVTRPIGICPVDEAVEQALHWTGLGFKTLKMKVGTDPDRDIERVLAVRRAVPGARIRIDANQGYDLPSAIKVLRAVGDAVEYCEQPLPAWDIQGLRTLRAATGVRITLDEAVHNVRDLIRACTAEAVDAIVIKLIKCGGLRAAERLAGTAAAYGIGTVVVSTFDLHVGAAACVHLAMSLASTAYAQELSLFCVDPEGPYTRADVPTTGSRILPPAAPGLGATFRAPA
ncbi:MAG TPA: dipeptide epimerase [Bacillota bacterium]